MSAIAILLLASSFIFLMLPEIRGERGWIEFVVMGLILALAVPAQFAKLKRRAKKQRVAKSTRDTVQKHVWELKHNREW
jgi:hypothetical protein